MDASCKHCTCLGATAWFQRDLFNCRCVPGHQQCSVTARTPVHADSTGGAVGATPITEGSVALECLDNRCTRPAQRMSLDTRALDQECCRDHM